MYAAAWLSREAFRHYYARLTIAPGRLHVIGVRCDQGNHAMIRGLESQNSLYEFREFKILYLEGKADPCMGTRPPHRRRGAPPPATIVRCEMN